MRALNAGQIIRLLRKIPSTKNIFKGVATRDLKYRVPKKNHKKPQAFIQNTGYIKRGVHWILIFFSEESSLVFDSFGRAPKVLFLESSVIQPYKPITYNPYKLQSPKSLVCGHYCIFFLYYLSQQKKIEQINRLFSENRLDNDKLVFKFVQALAKKWGVSMK